MRITLTLIATAALFATGGCAEAPECPKCPEPPEAAKAAAAEPAEPTEPAACPKCPTCTAPAEGPRKDPEANPDTSAEPVALPPFVLRALTGPHGKRAKLIINSDGHVTKSCAYVGPGGVPGWVVTAADKALGKGEDLQFEVEQYNDGSQAYEVTRKVNGKVREVSLDAKTKKVRYVEEKDLPLEELTGAVRAAADKVGGFQLTGYDRKMSDEQTVHELSGKVGGQPWTLEVGSDGSLLAKRPHFEASLRVAR